MTEAQATELPVREGEVLAGKYRVERVLGAGGMGVVVAAMHAELDQKVAIKILLPQAAQNPAVVARFSREARAAAKIKSEHVVRVSDVGNLDSGLPYIVMEHLDGQDLAQVLSARERLPPSVAIDYVLQACEALAEAHAAGFVHRDLKPGNLFLARTPDGGEMVKVLDFGISKAVIGEAEPASGRPGSLTRTTDVFGSPLYMSPEQLKSARDVDARADVWALGVILYELISGKTPFDRPTVAETFGAILYEKPEPLRKLPDVSAELDAAVLRCLEKDAAVRFQNVAELAKALLPSADPSARISVARTSRVLKRAGLAIETVPPSTAAKASTNLSPQSSTRTSWGGSDGAPRPRSGRTAVLVGVGLALALGAAILFGVTRVTRGAPRPAVQAADPPAVPVPSAAPTVAVTAAPTVAPAATVEVVPSATVSAAPSVTPSATVAPASPPPARDRPAPPVKTAAPAAPTPPAPPPKPVVKSPEDPNGFGDRK